jgi:very-short-patch-repair endonuclease
MGKESIVRGQNVSPEMLERAREMRQNMPPAERRLWQRLRANRLDGWHFRRQQIIGGFIVDFYCHKAGLVIEVDGPIHQQQKDQDAERDEILSARGLHVIRFSNRDVMNNIGHVLQTIHDELKTNPPFLKERG